MTYRIAIDTGGTFTDVVVADAANKLHVNKALTNHNRVYQGIEEALQITAESLGLSAQQLLTDTSLFIYSTTRATNAILEGTTARTAFITTQGFRDTLLIREGGRPNAYDYTIPFPAPYIPRRLTFGVIERINAEGEIETPIDSNAARELVRHLKSLQIEAIGISLLWSIANPVHEKLLGEIIAEELPNVPFTLSHELNPIIREYRRASSTAIDASLKPVMQSHLQSLEEDLTATGFSGQLLAATSLGGMIHIADLIERPIYSTRSGPSMAPVAGKVYGGIEAPGKDVIICDTGGTSFDVSLVRDNEVVFTRETWLGGHRLGHITGLSSVDARSIGAGGGSIAWVDSGGLLRVGPRSAGSAPGPAAYGLGGTEPTVTDAAVALGYINPDNFLGGRISLDKEASLTAIEKLAKPLGIPSAEAAMAVISIASEAMVQAVQEMTVAEGVDPRDCLILAGGGAAGLSIGIVAKELGASQVLIPRTASALSACGAQFSDIITEESANLFTSSSRFDFEGVNAMLENLEKRLHVVAEGLALRGFVDTSVTFSTEARYEGQNWELEIPFTNSRFQDESDLARLVDAFHKEHRRCFTVDDPSSQIETLSWKARLTAAVEKPSLEAEQVSDSKPSSRTRPVYFAETGLTEAEIYDGAELEAGLTISGPAVIEETTTTVVVFPQMTLTVTPYGNYSLELEK